jgi:hypothetical protein
MVQSDRVIQSHEACLEGSSTEGKLTAEKLWERYQTDDAKLVEGGHEGGVQRAVNDTLHGLHPASPYGKQQLHHRTLCTHNEWYIVIHLTVRRAALSRVRQTRRIEDLYCIRIACQLN